MGSPARASNCPQTVQIALLTCKYGVCVRRRAQMIKIVPLAVNEDDQLQAA